MPFSRFAKMPAEKRERLLTAAAQEFATHGFEAASLNRILENVQIGKSSAYYYFEDKADLFCAVTEYCLDRLQLAPAREELDLLSVETFWPFMEDRLEQPLQGALQAPWLFGVIQAVERLTPESLQRPALAKLVSELTDYMQTNIGAMITRGQELGFIRTDVPQELLLAWFRAIDSASDDWLFAHLEQMKPEAIARISKLTMKTIRQALAPPAEE